MKIYTKTGDEGKTGLLGGSRVQKHSIRIHAIGEVDELNSFVGLAAVSVSADIHEHLSLIQHRLFDLGSELACEPGGDFQITSVTATEIAELETSIDQMTSNLPPLEKFILPGGSESAARLHICRSVCRRVERTLQALAEREAVRKELLVYTNRLSDWFFTASRYQNAQLNIQDVFWEKKSQ